MCIRDSALDCFIPALGDQPHAALYAGHGQSKTVLSIKSVSEELVLKLTRNANELRTRSELNAFARIGTELTPRVVCAGIVRGLARNNRFAEDWLGWVCERVIPVDNFFRTLPDESHALKRHVLLLALCTIIRLAHFHNFLISDNGLCNFGIRVDGSVILIDAGSRGFADRP